MKVNVLSDVCHNMGIQIHLANTAKNIQNVKDISCTNIFKDQHDITET